MRSTTIIGRSLRLRCPRCGQGRLFAGMFRMHAACDRCEMKFDRGPGYYLGSIYVNYALTAMLSTAGFFALYFSEAVSSNVALAIVGAFCVLFPLWFFRYARSIWLGFDEIFDPSAQDSQRGSPPPAS